MNRQFSNAPARTMIGKAILTVLVLLTISLSEAQSEERHDSARSKTTSVSYLGSEDEMLIFGIQHENLSSGKFSVEIRESAGEVLFREVYSDKVFSKKFALPNYMEGKLNFVIKNLKDNTTETYEVNTNVRFSQDVVVTKLK